MAKRERKTIDIETVKAYMNARIERAEDINVRRALCSTLSDLLMEAGVYHGFRYRGGWTGTEKWDHVYY
jgi:hypothetical protein